MENKLQIFDNPEFGKIRVVEIDGQNWFVLKDVCAAFGETNYRRVASRLDDDEKGVSQIITPGGPQQMTVVNEPGLYSSLFAMQPEKARGVTDDYIEKRMAQLKSFKHWVTHDVLPSIKKHGAYMTPDTIDRMIASPEFGIKLLTELKTEQEKRKALEEKVQADAPAVRFANAITSSDTNILVRELAKILTQNGFPIGGNRLFELLRNDGYLIKTGSDYNLPTQKAAELGLFFIKESPRISKEGAVIDRTVMVTPKAQKYFINKYAPKQALN